MIAFLSSQYGSTIALFLLLLLLVGVPHVAQDLREAMNTRSRKRRLLRDYLYFVGPITCLTAEEACDWWKRGYQDAQARLPFRQAPAAAVKGQDPSPELLPYWEGYEACWRNVPNAKEEWM